MKIFKTKKGFTLVEMLIAVGLFTLIASISLGAILSIFDANRRSRSSKTVVDNLNLSIENMVRTVRFGDRYHCGTSGGLSNPQNCSNGDTFLAVRFESNTHTYRYCNNSEIRWSSTGQTNCNNMAPITSSDMVVEYLRFYVFNTSTSDQKQPYVIAVIKGYVGNKPTIQSKFSIQTVMSQRIIDYNG
jgi:prepilin-type N-terminal cleavage/methylation domain-containing protein